MFQPRKYLLVSRLPCRHWASVSLGRAPREPEGEADGNHGLVHPVPGPDHQRHQGACFNLELASDGLSSPPVHDVVLTTLFATM
jgi:hypothetical protein